MRRKISIIVAAIAISVGSLMAKDIQTLTVTTQPQMHCAACETRIKNFLKFEKGIKKIETNIAAQKVTVTYDADKISEKSIIETFNKNKYEVKKVDESTKDTNKN